MMADDTHPPLEWGSFSVRQDGITVAGGSGPYEDIKREAAHYAAIYRQDGNVQVRVRRSPKKTYVYQPSRLVAP